MKKFSQYLFISFFFLSLASFGQKVKIKKGKVLVDKVASALFKEEGRHEYLYSDLNTKAPVFKAKLVGKKVTNELTKQWLEVSLPDGSKTTEVAYEILSFSLSMKKIISYLFVKKYKLIKQGGIDNDAVTAFFNEERPSISKEVDELIKNEVQKEQAIAGITGFEVDTKRNYIFKDSIPYGKDRRGSISSEDLEAYDNYLGYYHLLSNGQTNFKGISTLKFYDLSRRNVAIANFGNFGDATIDFPFLNDGKGAKVKYKSSVPFIDRGSEAQHKLIDEALRHIIYNGVTLGNQYKDEQKAKKQVEIAKYEEAMKQSNNVYHEIGYYETKSGQKINGLITIIYSKLNGFTFAHEDAVVPNGEYGKYLHVRKLKDSGNVPVKIKAKSRIKACFIDGKPCFRGVRLSTLKGYRYLEIVEELDKIGVYKTYKSNAFYISLFNNPEKRNALRVTESTALIKLGKEDINKKLEDFLGKCYKPEYKNLNMQDLDDVLKLAKDYNNTCN
ncbi:hypothetical protein [uncultured Tenacibaculum sp.]|uniref:hypothetical protein n=1 Tax=uncultured Tenacibaculum sp. TaxID=174713 RepID=UPI00261FE280|nr:hypothetical protein [uncultured Tenacibaculum sp.]